MSRARAVTILVLLALGVSAAWATDTSPTVVVRPFSAPGTEKLDTLPQSLGATLSAILRQNGFVSVDGSEAHPARFEATGLLVRENGNIVLQIGFTDLQSHSLVASDEISVYDGLTALNPMSNSMLTVVRKVAEYWDQVSKVPLPVPPIQDSLVFTSRDEGAEVFWQGHVSAGKIAKGRVTAPYYPFPSNGALTLTVEKVGYGPETVTITLSPDKIEYTLPKLVKLRTDELFPLISTGRLLGFGAEYRYYFLPDWAFVGAEVYPFLQFHPGAGSSLPVYHLDATGSLGTWLILPAHSWFRFGLEASVNLSQTWTSASSTAPSQWFLDATISPFGFLLEWNIWGFTIENRIEIPYSVGLPSGILGPRWLLVDGIFPMLSVGTVLQW